MSIRVTAALGLALLVSSGLGGCDPQGGGADADAGNPDARQHDAGPHQQHPSDAGRPSGHSGWDASLPVWMASSSDPVCSLHVGAECDGAEDCPTGQVCCAKLSTTAPTYESISCRTSCEQPSAYQLCHPGNDSCPAGSQCRSSYIIPYDFIAVCASFSAGSEVLTGRSIAGEIQCGDTTCRAGSEKCCLRASVKFGASLQTLPLYCARLDDDCDCNDEPVHRDEDGG